MDENVAVARLYLTLEAGESALPRLAALLRAAPFESVLIKPQPGRTLDASMARTLVEAAQANHCAVLIASDARLARTLRADGVHLAWSADIAEHYSEARSLLGQRGIIGGSAGGSRHEAMVLAEAGADYIGFGLEPSGTTAAEAHENRAGLIEWWAEIFQVPCVAFDVATAEDAAALAQAGADFIGLSSPAGDSVAEAVAAFTTVAGHIAPLADKRRD